MGSDYISSWSFLIFVPSKIVVIRFEPFARSIACNLVETPLSDFLVLEINYLFES